MTLYTQGYRFDRFRNLEQTCLDMLKTARVTQRKGFPRWKTEKMSVSTLGHHW